MGSFQGIIFILKQTLREIFKSALVLETMTLSLSTYDALSITSILSKRTNQIYRLKHRREYKQRKIFTLKKNF